MALGIDCIDDAAWTKGNERALAARAQRLADDRSKKRIVPPQAPDIPPDEAHS